MKFLARVLKGKYLKQEKREEEKNEKKIEDKELVQKQSMVEERIERNREKIYIDKEDLFGKKKGGRTAGNQKKKNVEVEIVNNLLGYLETAGISQTELGRRLGVTKQYVSQITKAKSVNLETAFAILCVLDLEERDIALLFSFKKES